MPPPRRAGGRGVGVEGGVGQPFLERVEFLGQARAGVEQRYFDPPRLP